MLPARRVHSRIEAPADFNFSGDLFGMRGETWGKYANGFLLKGCSSLPLLVGKHNLDP